MNTVLFILVGMVIAMTIGAVAVSYPTMSGLVYVFLALVDSALFSFFCVRKKIVLRRNFGFYVIVHIALFSVFVAARHA